MRPFSIRPRLVNQQSAATVDPNPPSIGLANSHSIKATLNTNSADGRRAVHSLRTPKSLNEPATIQLTRGGLHQYRIVPIDRDQLVPLSSLCIAGLIPMAFSLRETDASTVVR